MNLKLFLQKSKQSLMKQGTLKVSFLKTHALITKTHRSIKSGAFISTGSQRVRDGVRAGRGGRAAPRTAN